MELYNANEMPLSNDERKRTVQEKILKGEQLNISEKRIAGRDHPKKNLFGYQLKPDHCYRAISKELLEIYKKTGYIYGTDEDDEYQEYIENGQLHNNNRGVDWYLGGVTLRYGYIVIECPAYKEYFTPASDNGNSLAFDPTIRHMKSSGFKNPIPTNLITNVFDTKLMKEQQNENSNRDNKTFEQVKEVYKKVQNILDENGLKVYLSGGTVPYILQNEDSGRLHDDIDTICEKEDMNNLREVFKKEGFYKEEWDSKTYATDGVDYGFETMIDGVPYGIYPFSYNKGAKKMTQYSFDPYTKECKQKTMPMEELSDYVMTYRGLDGKTYDMMSLEYIKLSKDNAGREKDIIDSKKIEETKLLRNDVMNRISMFNEIKNQPQINNDMNVNEYYEEEHMGRSR